MPNIAAPAAPIPYGIGRGVECVLPVPTTNSANTTPYPDTQSVTTTKKRQPIRMKISKSDVKRLTQIPWSRQVKLPDHIGKYVIRDVEEVTRIG